MHTSLSATHPVPIIVRVLIGLSLEQLADLAGVAVHGGVVKRRLTAVILHVSLRAVQQQEL